MIFYLIIHVLCAFAAWHLVTTNAPATDLSTPAFGCLAAALCFLFGPLALIVVILLLLCQRG